MTPRWTLDGPRRAPRRPKITPRWKMFARFLNMNAILPFLQDLPREIVIFEPVDIAILPFLKDLPRKITFVDKPV